MKFMVLNGPNLNLIGKREISVYGNKDYLEYMRILEDYAKVNNIDLSIFQSNHEGKLVDLIHTAYFEKYDGIIINPAAYTHTSIAIRDAIAAIKPIPVIEVHFSDIYTREKFREISYCKDVCIRQICGKSIEGYIEAIDILKEEVNCGRKSE
ncbi:MAG: type II 3-dehydroquinate dehydratase [Anaerorhabdus sp.]